VIQPLRSRAAPPSPIMAALSACRNAFAAIGLLTGVINVLMLTGSLFMLQVYDRVLPSRSVPTLIACLPWCWRCMPSRASST
jgi:ABC-type protease/lipase transport system fused ATPase/permease subunit